MQNIIQQKIIERQLPEQYGEQLRSCIEPIAGTIASRLSQKLYSSCPVIGIQGAQGSGKTTVCEFLQLLLNHRFNLNVAVLSIDDLYRTLLERKQLSKQVHPLLITRGVPGTHDVGLGLEVIHRLKSLRDGESFFIPRFDKATDDRCPKFNGRRYRVR